ncbi:hypothetical protein QJQ45_005819 [Haematococcus lacustris]|nr:hypothetical protein QJQ45_005819 [Haematococcus lacustris]
MSEAPQHAKRRMASGLRGTSLPPPLLPNGLGGSSLKKHKTHHKTKSAWVMEQLTAVTAPTSDPDETDGAVNFVLRYMCNHCQDNLAGSNKDRLKRHLLRCSKFLASTQAMNIAKTFSEIAAAIEEYKQENKEVAELQQDAGTTPNSKSTARADTWLEPDYAVGMGLTMDRFAPDLTVDPVAWWRRYGKKLPHLQVVAQRVLSIPATSAATERLFSAFKFIWSDRRSRLLLGRMWIMSYVFFNTRVMTRKEHHASAEAQEEWESYMAAQVVLDAPQL